jgi:hypothetical protein
VLLLKRSFDASKRIYYRKSDGFGTQGYIASSYIEEINEYRCRFHILSWFDFEGEAPTGIARYQAIYSGIFEGFKAHFSVQCR